MPASIIVISYVIFEVVVSLKIPFLRVTEMLGYVGSKSKPFVLKDEGIIAFPDEVSHIDADAQHAVTCSFRPYDNETLTF